MRDGGAPASTRPRKPLSRLGLGVEQEVFQHGHPRRAAAGSETSAPGRGGRSRAPAAPSRRSRPEPDLAGVRPARRPLTTSKSVVFPAPLGPMRPVMLPSPTSRLTPSRAWRPPKRFLTPRTVRRASRATRGPTQTVGPSWIAAASLPGTRRPSPAWPRSLPSSTTTLPRSSTMLRPAVHLPALPGAVVGAVEILRRAGCGARSGRRRRDRRRCPRRWRPSCG